MKKIACFIFITICYFSCVSKKKYDELLKHKLALEVDKAACENNYDSLLRAKNQLINDSVRLYAKLKNTEHLLDEEEDRAAELRSDIRHLIDKSTKETGQLTGSLADKQKQLAEIEKNLQDAKRQNDQLAASLAEREKKIQELQKVLDDKDKKVNDLKNKISNALLSFKDADLTVSVKNGKVYVSLAEQLLFKSASTTVDKKGAEALKKLAQVLKEQNEVNVMVEGHTDDVPLQKGYMGMNDNWDLSVLRATSIVRLLTSEGVQPQKLTPSGKGEFSPVAEGKNEASRTKNRRTEIIITPKLDEIFRILENN
ncbi:MAG: OmpA family protein [Opitutaceae bacterium]|nr:OmpA family protein [Cytophagales bacterium]